MRKGRSGTKLSVAAGAALGATALIAPVADGATFTVTNTDDAGTGSLREAVQDANDNGEDDVITFQAGLTGTIDLEGGTSADIDILNESLQIQGPGADQITVDAGGQSSVFSLYSFNSPDEQVSISGLTITGGNTPEGSFNDDGGGVFISDQGGAAAEVTLDAVVITDNYADFDGGGLYAEYGSLTITNSVISDNTAGNDGGGVYSSDTDGDQPVEVRISQTVVSGNEAIAGEGGGIFLDENDADAVIERSTVSGNTSFYEGAGIFVDFAVDAGVTIDSTTASGNTTPFDDGGGIFIGESDEAITVQNSTVAGNYAYYDGGGIALYADTDDDDNVAIRNSTIVDNTTGSFSNASGGGLYRGSEELNATYYGDEIELSSTIVANNSSPDSPDIAEPEDTETGAFITGFSLIEDPSGNATIDEAPAGSNIFGQDPQLGALAANGGPTQTLVPAATSPVLDKGIANGLGTDQRGLARTSDSALIANATGADGTDIGAVEVQVSEADCQGVIVKRTDGTEGDDTLTGSDAGDAINGLGGNDSANAQGGKDCVSGGGGKDRLNGAGGRDQVKGDAGKDNLKGGGGKDRLNGGGGKDKLSGGGGKDRLKGGPGKDKLKGGGGKDRFNCGGGKDKVTAQEKDKVSASCEKVIEKG